MESTAIRQIVAEREKAKAAYDAAISGLDALELAAARCDELAKAWEGSAKGRTARVWLWTGYSASLTLVLVLNRGDEFGMAADHFAAATARLADSFPDDWTVTEAEKVEDGTYSADCAARVLRTSARPPGGGYRNEVDVSVRVELPVGEGDACRVIKVGERPALTSSYSPPMPIYKALCPGDALPVGGVK